MNVNSNLGVQLLLAGHLVRLYHPVQQFQRDLIKKRQISQLAKKIMFAQYYLLGPVFRLCHPSHPFRLLHFDHLGHLLLFLLNFVATFLCKEQLFLSSKFPLPGGP